MRAFWLSTLLFLPLVSACSESNLARASATDSFSQVPSNEVDVLWIVDNSTSMNEEQASVANAAADFTEQLESANMDFHLGVISTDVDPTNANAGKLLGNPPYLTSECRNDGDNSDCQYSQQFQSRVLLGTTGSDQEKGLQAAINATTAPLSETYNAGFLRDDALLMIIILSDENDCSDGGALGTGSTGEDCYNGYDQLLPVADLARQLRDIKNDTLGSVVMSGIIGPDVVDNCEHAVPGKRYRTAIDILGGAEADICLADYAPIMQSLGLQASDLISLFQLTHAADVETIEVSVDPVDGDAYAVPEDGTNGWTYLEDLAKIQFNGEMVPPRGAAIEVHYVIDGAVPEPDESAG